MTVQPPTPEDAAQSAVVNLIQAAITILGLLGVSVPAVFKDLATEQQIASIILVIIGAAWSLRSHIVKDAKIRTLQLRTAQQKWTSS